MANVKLSELTAATSVVDANEFEINESGTSKKVTAAQIQSYIESNLTSGSKMLKGDGSGGVADATATNGTSGQYLKTNGDGTFDWESVVTFDSGTRMIFAQNTAPTGWTKDTTNYDQHALRVTTGTAATGGTVDFTTAFASVGVSVSGSTNAVATSGTVQNHTLSTAQMPSHTHTYQGSSGTTSGNQGKTGPANYSPNRTTSATGGGGAHSHGFQGSSHSHTFSGTDTINLAVKYLDVITATKD